MSRTDKDRPPWVRAKDEPNPSEWHNWLCETRWPHWGIERQRRCEIDDRHAGKCQRMPSFRTWRSNPPKWYRHVRWYDPERQRERMVLNSFAKEHNAGYDLEGTDFPNYQHRHKASWEWD